LLLALGLAPDRLAGRALRELGVSLEELPIVIERLCAQALPTEPDQIEEVRRNKELAIEADGLRPRLDCLTSSAGSR